MSNLLGPMSLPPSGARYIGNKDGVPVHPTRRFKINGGNREFHTDYATAMRHGSVSIVVGVDGNDHQIVLDFDGDVLDGTTRDIDLIRQGIGWASREAWEIAKPFLDAGCSLELSSSQVNVHIFGYVGDKSLFAGLGIDIKLPGGKKIQVFRDKKPIAFGGGWWKGNGRFDADVSHLVPMLVEKLRHKPVATNGASIMSAPRDGALGPSLTDEQIIQKALNADGPAFRAFGARFRDYWEKNVPALVKAHPLSGDGKSTGEGFDHSGVDAALMMELAFWTGCDGQRMHRLFSMSALGKRPKWTDRSVHPTYDADTVNYALANCKNIYDGVRRRDLQRAENVQIGEGIEATQLLPEMMLVDQMIERLVMIGGHTVADRKTKRIRAKEHAATEYAASQVENGFDSHGKQKLVPALAIWTKSPDRLTVDQLSWQAIDQEFIASPEGHGLAFNKFRGIKRLSLPPGFDWRSYAQPFIDHLRYLIQVDAEFRRFVQFLAHIAQRPWELPETGWLFVATQTGIGRNWLSSLLVRVFRGYVAAGVDLGAILDGPYNDRLSEKLIAIVDEIRDGMAGDVRHKRAQRFNALINEEFRYINAKHQRQYTEYNSCRWIMFTNHPDAIPMQNNDRRINVVENPTERKPPEYYERIYALLDDPLFIASVQQLLFSEDISDFKPGDKALENVAKANALKSMRSEVDKSLINFHAGWPGDICGRRDVKEYLAACDVAFSNDIALNHSLSRSGFRSTGKEFKRNNGRRDTVLVLRNLSDDEVKQSDPFAIRNIVEAAAAGFALI